MPRAKQEEQSGLPHEFEVLKTINSWIESANTRAGIILAFNGAIFAFLFTQLDKLKVILPLFYISLIFYLPILIFTGYIIAFLVSLFHILKTLYPDITIRKPSLFFFGSISNLPVDEYKNKFKHLTRDELINQILEQVHINSGIASTKNINLQKAIYTLFISILLASMFLITLFLLSFPKSQSPFIYKIEVLDR